MATSASRCPNHAGLRRQRSPSLSINYTLAKRQRWEARFDDSLVEDRPRSVSSSSASVSHSYGIGDENALDNLFASYPQTFSSLPHPHGSQGLHEPPWDLRFDHEIYLQNDFFPGERRCQPVRAPIPGPELDPVSSKRHESPPSAQKPPTRTRTEFVSAMSIVQEVIGEGRRLTIDFARSYERVREWRERWGWSPLSSDAYDSPPPYSPTHGPPTTPPRASPVLESINSSLIRQSLSPEYEPIPNPTIPGEPAPSAEALFRLVNKFAKENGFGIVRRNAYSYKGRRVRYSFQCDRFGQPGASKGAGIRKRKSRKCGCRWMVIAEAVQEGNWLLRQHENPEHGQHNHHRSISSSAHPSHRPVIGMVWSVLVLVWSGNFSRPWSDQSDQSDH